MAEQDQTTQDKGIFFFFKQAPPPHPSMRYSPRIFHRSFIPHKNYIGPFNLLPSHGRTVDKTCQDLTQQPERVIFFFFFRSLLSFFFFVVPRPSFVSPLLFLPCLFFLQQENADGPSPLAPVRPRETSRGMKERQENKLKGTLKKKK